jgi:uncharacterized protein (TIGR03083 family)
MDLVVALREAWSAVIVTLEGLEPGAWENPTPCAGWNVHDVAAHLAHLEGMAHGFDQPAPPPDFDADAFEGFHRLTEEGVAARRATPHKEVLDEIRLSSQLTLGDLAKRDGAGWDELAPSPVGMVPARHAAEIRLSDVYVHLLDLRHGLGITLDPSDEPAAAGAVIARALRLSGWAAVKQAGLEDGTRIRLAIDDGGGDLVVSGGRGNIEPPQTGTVDRIVGPGLAFVLTVAGRGEMAAAAGGLEVSGDSAEQFLAGYRLFF